VGEILVPAGAVQVDLPGRIIVRFNVLSRLGAPIGGLTLEDGLELFEDGEPVSFLEGRAALRSEAQVFRSFAHLLLDRSGSVDASPATREAQVDAALAFVRGAALGPESRVRVSWFDGQEELHPLIDFTDDLAELDDAVMRLHDEPPLDTSTNLHGALLADLDDLDDAALASLGEGVRAPILSLVTFTDGRDRAGIATLEEAEGRVRAETGGRRLYRSYTIGLGAEVEPEVLVRLGPEGARFADHAGELIADFQDVACRVGRIAEGFYVLSYCSPSRDGSGPHVLRIDATSAFVTESVELGFSADFFGAGCGELEVRTVFGADAPVLAPVFANGVGDAVEDDAGRVVLCGRRLDPASGSFSAFVMRLLADGSPDPAFGQDGLALLDAGAAYASSAAHGLALDGERTFVCGAAAPAGGPAQSAFWRLGPDGSIEAHALAPLLSADGDLASGAIFVDRGSVDGGAEARLVACGTAGLEPPTRSAVWRLDPELAPDPAFGSSGVVLHAVDNSDPRDRGTALVSAGAPDGGVVVLGSTQAQAGAPTDLKLLRLLDDGALDAAFGTGGVVTNLGAFQGSDPGVGFDLAVGATGRIVVAGALLTAELREDPAVWRLLPDGAPDAEFAGSVQSRFPGTGVVTLPVALTADDRVDFGRSTVLRSLALHEATIVAAGQRANAAGGLDLVTLQLAPDGVLDGGYNTVGFLIEDGSGGQGSGRVFAPTGER